MTSQRQQSAVPAMAGGDVQEVSSSISDFLKSKGVKTTQAWLQSFMTTVRLNTPLVALQKTALFRLLATDIKVSLVKSPSSCFPFDISNPQTKEQRVRGPVTVQILDIEDIGRSCWGQVEAIEAQERGETTKGREVIRVIPDENNVDNSTQPEPKSSGPHKLHLEDANGTHAYAIELMTVNGLSVQMPIGAKLMLKDFTVARGVILLEPRNAELLGGKVETWDKKWREERKQKLKAKAGQSN